ncbi:MAG: hypothetical protein ACRC77_09645, partial [Bacteroidales bacterium]
GKGDICEYMTRRGWTPQGKKWRIPDTELSLAKEYITEGNTSKLPDPGSLYGDCEANSYLRFNNITLPHTSFVHRLSNGMSNVSSLVMRSFYCRQYRTDVTSLYDVLLNVKSYSLNTYYGMAVRCVVDDTPGEVTPLYVVSYDLSGGDAGDITAPTPEGIILNQHVDAGGNIILSNIKLTSSKDLFHRGWLIDGKEYPLGGTISNVQKNYVAKPVWGYSRTLALKANGTLGFWEFADGTNLNVLYFKWGSIIGSRIPDADYEIIKQGRKAYYNKDWNGFNPSNLTTDFSDYINDLPTSIPSGQFPDMTIENITKGLGDPCRLVGYTADEIKSYISKKQLPPDNGWRMPEVILTDPKYGMPSSSYYATVPETGYPGAWLAMEKDGINTVYKEFLPSVSRIVTNDRQGTTWNYPYSNYLSKTVDNAPSPELFRYKYQWITSGVNNNPQSWTGKHHDSHLIRCVPNK